MTTSVLSHASHTIIKASAGSGKTYQLALAILRLLAKGVAPDQILATSFTKKAAAEIYGRVITLLKRAAEGNTIDGLHLEKQEAAQILNTLLRKANTLQVTTLDAWYAKIAQRFSSELGLPNNWAITSEAAKEEQALAAIQNVLLTIGAKDVAVIVRALRHEEAPKLVTPILLETFSKLTAVAHIAPASAWAWLKDESSTAEIVDEQKVWQDLVGFEIPLTKANAPHKTWQKALDKVRSTFSAREWKEFFNDGFVTKFIESQAYSKIPFSEKNATVMHACLSHAAAGLKILFLQQLTVAQLCIQIFEEALSAEESKGQISFDRIKAILARYLRSEYGDSLRYRLDHKTRHILFDEFQDTSWTDWAVLEAFVKEALSQGDESKSLFIVGDTKQAIYAWRGGTCALFEAVEALGNNQLATVPLSVSRRSSIAVIDFVNTVFNGLSMTGLPSTVVQHFGADWLDHSTAKKDVGYAEVCIIPGGLETEGADESPYTECALAAAKKLSSCLAMHTTASIGVLFRSNKDVAAFSKLLHERKITHSAEGGTYLMHRLLVQVLAASLKSIAIPTATVGRYLAQRSGIEFEALRETYVKQGLLATIDMAVAALSPKASADEQACFQIIQQQAALHQFGLDEFLRELPNWKLEMPGHDRVRLLTMHSSKGLEFDVVLLPSLNEPLLQRGQDTGLWLFREQPTHPPSRVSFPFPRALNNIDYRFEEIYSQQEAERLREALNLLYVAVTRAKHHLFAFVPEKPLKNSFADILSLTATQRVFGSESALSSVQSERPTPQPLLRPKPPKPSVRANAIFSRRSASKEGQSFQAERSSSLAQQGSLQHLLFSQVTFLESTPLEKLVENLTVLKNCHPTGFYDALYFLQSDFAKSVFSQTRYPAPQVNVYNERKLLLEKEESFIIGTVDRLVLWGRDNVIEGAEILDFKTGAVDVNMQPEKLEGYETQLALYRTMVSKAFNLKETAITCTLIFTKLQRERRLP